MMTARMMYQYSSVDRPWPQTGRDGSYWQQPGRLTSPAVSGHLLTVSQAVRTHDDAAPVSITQLTNKNKIFPFPPNIQHRFHFILSVDRFCL